MKLKIDFKKRIFDIWLSKSDVVVLYYLFNDRSTDIQSILDTISNLFYLQSQKRRAVCLQ